MQYVKRRERVAKERQASCEWKAPERAVRRTAWAAATLGRMRRVVHSPRLASQLRVLCLSIGSTGEPIARSVLVAPRDWRANCAFGACRSA